MDRRQRNLGSALLRVLVVWMLMLGPALILGLLLGQDGLKALVLGLPVWYVVLGSLGLLILLKELPGLGLARPRLLKMLRPVRWELNWVRLKAPLTFKTKYKGE